MTTQQTITTEEFEQRFKPQKNPLNPNASWDGCMYETFGKELERVTMYQDAYIWTITECDGHVAVTSGFHLVNRMGYLITEVPCPPDTMIEVDDPEDTPEFSDDDLIEAARQQWCFDDEVQIADDAAVDRVDDGAWVDARVFIRYGD